MSIRATLDVQILDDPAAACAEMLVAAAAGGGQIVLTGGSTPRAAYEHAATAAADWSGATAWFSDERCVPPDDERSNYRLADESLLRPLADRAPAVQRMEGELGPGPGADRYESLLRSSGPPRFDLVLLGLGPDAHIASLFPGQDTLAERDRLVVPVERAGHEPFVPRISLTLRALSEAQRILLLVTGAAKAHAVTAAFGPDARPDASVPASLLVTLGPPITLLLDRDAGAGLR
jgi:6-phosphogluconolactonase